MSSKLFSNLREKYDYPYLTDNEKIEKEIGATFSKAVSNAWICLDTQIHKMRALQKPNLQRSWEATTLFDVNDCYKFSDSGSRAGDQEAEPSQQAA